MLPPVFAFWPAVASTVLALARAVDAPPLPALSTGVACAELEAHVRTLASDALDGRATGTAGERTTADYLARVLAAQKVTPAGDDGTFLQRVPLWRHVAKAPSVLSWTSKSGTASVARRGVDFEVGADGATTADLEVRVVSAEGDVPKEARAELALFIDAPLSKRRAWLAAAGHADGAGFGLILSPLPQAPSAPRERHDERVVREKPSGALPARVGLWGELLEHVRSGSAARVRFESNAEWQPFDSFNVVGKIPARKAADGAAEEAIVVSAHFDHLGELPDGAPSSSPDPERDFVFNGADDDASGVAAVLEIAGALATEPPPARTIVFLLATGEEIGLLGTREYLDRPVVPLERTVANLNFEMIGRPDALVGGAGILWLTGYERTNLGPAFTEKGLAIHVDPRPEQNFYQRSDNIAFVRKGIVGQTLSSYNLHADYHTVDDEPDRIDYAHLCACTRAGLDAVRLLASDGFRPQWSAGFEPKPR
ncbi:MAG: M20/M25/M40 family metallo-hydrolase [Planctomycetota bacterium]